MLLILVASTAGYAFFSSPTQDNPTTKTTEGDIVFQGNQWIVTHNGRNFYFANSPESETIRQIPVETSVQLTNYFGKTLYIDSENSAVLQEIGLAFQGYAQKIQEACYGSCPDRDIPEKTCEDNMIVWKDSIENKVYQEENCIFIEGDMEAVDAFLFKILGINSQQSF